MLGKAKRIAARLPTYWTYIRERPSWLPILVFGRVVALRRLERVIRRAKPQVLSCTTGTSVTANDPSRIIDRLMDDGVCTGLILRPEHVVAIRHFAETNQCVCRAEPQCAFLPAEIDAVNRSRERDIIAAYYFEKIESCAAIKSVEKDSLLRSIAKAFIGSTPQHIRTRLWWSFPGSRVSDQDLRAAAQNRYHFDLNDFRTLKFFFYLTDVGEHSGAHAFIRGSHRRRRIKHQVTAMVGHDENELRAFYKKEDFQIVVGPAGTGFIEDPFIFHLGRLCQNAPRLLLEIEYGPSAPSESYRYGVLG